MKVKEIERTANIAWSPADQHPIYVAAGTAAQQLDATFSTNAALEIYGMNLSEPGQKTNLVGKIDSDFRFHKLAWSSHGMNGDRVNGLLCGGTENGHLYVWDPFKIINNEEPVVFKTDKHTGSVGALDFNPFQANLLASGASDSEISIWDMNNPNNPMTPGSKSQETASAPADDVSCIAWNKQVQHILASTYTTRCVVWDLRKSEPIIKVSESMSRIKCKLVAWHPDVATQMCLSSEDDATPVIQLWDLRFATTYVKQFENHKKGIFSMAWCPKDPDLLLSCGKDNRILCWNPNSDVPKGEVIYELPTCHQWSFDVQWCPRNPAIISSCAFDGHISIYSLMGGEIPVEPINQITDSFGSMDPFEQAQAQQKMQQQQAEKEMVMPLKKPPRWFRRPVGACFGFGGRLVTFENTKPQPNQQPVPRQVHISQVVTETELLQRSQQLESVLQTGQFAEFCSMKVANSKDDLEESVWNFLKVNFEKEPRKRFLQLLGYDQTDLAQKVGDKTGTEVPAGEQGVDAAELAKRMQQLNTPVSEDGLANGQASPYVGSQPKTPVETDGAAAFDQIAGATEDEARSDSPFSISTSDDDIDGLINQAVLMGNLQVAVEMCIHDGRWAEAVILAIAGGPELLARTQKKYFKNNKDNTTRLISSVVTGEYSHVVETCDLENWKEALSVALTYAQADEFKQLCDTLGGRLERDAKLSVYSCLCYICSGNVEKLVQAWAKHKQNNNAPLALQDLVEKVMILRKAVEMTYGQPPEITSGALSNKLSHYAELLAAQGSIFTAMGYLGTSEEESLLVLRDRLYKALGQAAQGIQPPKCPFQVMNIQKQGIKPAAAPASAAQYGQPTSAYQAQANNTFQTSSTASTSYYNPAQQNQYTGYAGPSANQTTYSQANQPMGQQAPVASKAPSSTAQPRGGHTLAQKYPSYAGQAYGGVETYQQPSYFSPDFAQQTNYSQAGYSNNYSGDGYQNNPTQPGNIYNPAQSQVPDLPSERGGLMRKFTPPPLLRRKSSIYDDKEKLAGVLGSTSNQGRRRSLFHSESETEIKGGPVTPPVNVSNSAVPSFQDTRPERAWNDPPLVQGKEKTTSYDAPAPITTPIFNPAAPAAPEQNPPGAPANFGTQMYNPQEYGQQQQQQQPQQQHPPLRIPEPAKPVEKAPIPEEHLVLQDIFDNLTKRCLASATNPQMKRKLDDVHKKLEALYDRLRDQVLSQNVILGLHQIVQCVQQFNYQQALYIHTDMVNKGNFSEISSFMPGIKVLMQLAMQLRV
ncbi:protein transport protein Sec31A-like isoform X3 [Lineus longissimus]|uniref:protein transport protein Sec31A-like isoform X3 n=1 Tax=Lineus longissimus TaxID=88925 RepID=UPI00315CC842